MEPDDFNPDVYDALELTDEQRQAIVAKEATWRRQRLKEDLEQAKRRLETAMQLLADATVFLEEDDE